MKRTYNQKVTILKFEESEPDIFGWVEMKRVWGRKERGKFRNIFSLKGNSAQSYLFRMHPINITPHNLIMLDDEYYIVTEVNQISVVWLEVRTAKVRLVLCESETEIVSIEDEDKEPDLISNRRLKFPAIITSKYAGYAQQVPMVEITNRQVIITPKQIELEPSDIVTINGKEYIVHDPELTDEYKNEYEIERVSDN